MTEALRRLWCRMTGNVGWRVLYPDGKCSCSFRNKADAESLRNIFGGTVEAVYYRAATQEDGK